MRKKVSVLIDKEVLQKSHELGVNVSKACENYLKTLNATIEATNNKNSFLGPASFTKEGGVVRLPGFEPGSSTGQGEIVWEGFRKFCENGHRIRVSRQLVSYAEKYQDCLRTRDLSVIRDLNDTMRPNAMKGLSALSKFLGCYEDFKNLVKQYGLKWSGKSADDIFIERLTSVEDPEEIWTWICTVKKERPELSEFMDLMAVSGLRLIEAFNSFNLQGRLAREGKLDSSYFVADKNVLEHFRFKEIFIRKSKKAFVSFVPAQLVHGIAKKGPWTSTDSIQKMVQKRGLQLRFADIREAHGTFMNKFLKKEEIDFLHGRVTSSVFMQHYFNPALIVDLQARAFKGVAEILDKVESS